MSDGWARTRFRVTAFVGLLAMAAVSLATAETVTKKCTGVLTDDPPQADAQLGWAVDFDGTWLVGGAPGASAVTLYNNPQNVVPPNLRIPSPQTGDRFGSSVSVDGDWLAVGAPLGDGQVRDSGLVYLYQKSTNGTFPKIPTATLGARNPARDAQFGFAVALRGNTLVVGAPYDSDRGNRAGSLYVFQLSGDTWAQTVELHAEDARPFDLFGSAVAVAFDADKNLTVAVVGAPFADDLRALRNFGAAYVFEGEQGRWRQTTKLTADDRFRGTNIQFGAAVAIHGSRIAVGAPGDDLSGQDSGSAFVFKRNGASWDRHELVSGDPGAREQFGTSVDLGAKHVAVGAPFGVYLRTRPGAAYLFEGESRLPAFKLVLDTPEASDSTFGQSVALLDTTIYPGGPLYLNAGAIAVCPKQGPDIVLPILECEKTGPASVDAGKTVTYTIVVKNTGTATATGLKLIDPTPAGVERVSPACGKDNDNPCSLGPLGPNQSHQIEMKFRVPSIAACEPSPDPIVNVATVSADGEISDECSNDPPTSIQVPRDGKLVCEKSGPPTATKGDLITYEITVSNTGCKEVRNVLLEDPTPRGLILVDPPCPKPPCKLGTIQPDKPVKVEASFRVQECRESVENIAHVTGSGGLQDTCTFKTVLEGADLAVDVSVPASIPGGEELAVPVSVLNAGPRKATKVTLTVDLEGAGSVTGIPPDCRKDPDTPGRFTCTIAEIASGDSRLLTFRVKAPVCLDCAPSPEPIQVKAEVMSEVCDPDLSNNSDEAASQVICDCLPTIDKTDSPDPVAPGHAVTYDITVGNPGELDAFGVKVTDIAPDELTKIRWCRGANCQPTTPGPLVTQLDLPVGSSEIFRLRGIASECGTLVNRATAEHPPGTIAEAVEETQVEGISLLCTGIDGSWTEGSLITKRFLLINCGPNIQADNPGDEFTDTLPTGLTLVSVSADSGTPGMSGNTATWNGSVGVGDTVTIEVQATIDLGTLGMHLCNQAELSVDFDGDGINETTIPSDAPNLPGEADPCCIIVFHVIPTLSKEALLVLILLLVFLTLRRLRAAR